MGNGKRELDRRIRRSLIPGNIKKSLKKLFPFLKELPKIKLPDARFPERRKKK